MKRYRIWLPMLGLALLLLSACGGRTEPPSGEADWPVTMREIIDANRTDALLERYGSILVETAYEPEVDTTGLTTAVYADREVFYSQTDEEQELNTSDGVYICSEGVYGAVLLPEPADLSVFDYLTLDPVLTAAETITGVREDGDTLTVTTVLSADALAAYYEEYGADYYVEGTYSGEEYVLNASDYTILSDTTTEYHADGTSTKVGTVTVTCGAARPASAETLLQHQTAPERRTVTIVLDPGTAQERALSVTAQKGDVVFPYLPDGYVALYLDPFCTELFDGGADRSEDLTLYCQSLNPSAGADAVS